ncbi:MAG TPA: FtsX-like permease family protein, partial [Methylomirabilota bacterium]|nr:FtsX-like permease family protein [Methylomirabilota bacterium]
MYFEVRASRGPAALASAVRAAARQIDPNLTLFDLKTQDAQIEESLMQERLFVRLSGFFAGLATLLVAVGLYGLLAYTATQRFREIGVRMALGALPRDIARLVVGQGIALALAGIAFGSLAAAALTRFLAGLLFGVKPGDPATFIAVAALLLLVALVSCSIPAWRASRTDPMVALRYE